MSQASHVISLKTLRAFSYTKKKCTGKEEGLFIYLQISILEDFLAGCSQVAASIRRLNWFYMNPGIPSFPRSGWFH